MTAHVTDLPWDGKDKDWYRAEFEFADLERLLQIMVASPQPSTGISGDRQFRFSFEQALSYTLKHDFFCKQTRSGWITRRGKILACGYAAHERLLSWLGLEASDVEDAGWVRFKNPTFAPGPNWQATRRPTQKQIRALRELDASVANENLRLMPSGACDLTLPDDEFRALRLAIIGPL